MAVCHIFVPGFDNMSEEQQIHMAQTIDYPVRKTAHAMEYALLAGLVLGVVTAVVINIRYVAFSHIRC